MNEKVLQYKQKLVQANQDTARRAIDITHKLITKLIQDRHKIKEALNAVHLEQSNVGKEFKLNSLERFQALKTRKEMQHISKLEKGKNLTRKLNAEEMNEISQIRTLEQNIAVDLERIKKIEHEEEEYLKKSLYEVEHDIKLLGEFIHILEKSRTKTHYTHEELQLLHEDYTAVHTDMTRRRGDIKHVLVLNTEQKKISHQIDQLLLKIETLYKNTLNMIKKERKK